MRITGSGELCLDFNPATLQRYHVIVAPIGLDIGEIDDKILIVLCHGDSGVWCIKATTDRLGYYVRNAELLPGCVVYEGGLAGIFDRRTIIDPKRPYHVRYSAIRRDFTKNPERLIGVMPESFHQRLMRAIRDHPNMSNRLRIDRLGMMGRGGPMT